jgi:four helix bundle protein
MSHKGILSTKACRWLASEMREFDLSRQLLRSATSVGANIEEASGSGSPRDFAAKLRIAYKEAREADYWLRLLRDTELLPQSMSEPLLETNEQLRRLLGKSLTTVRRRIITEQKR